MLLPYLVTSRARRDLLRLLWAERAEGNVSELARMARVSFAAAHRELEAMREPVPGTIPRGRPPLHYAATPEDARRAGRELINPHRAANSAALARGEAVYQTFCLACHGPQGKGDGPVAQRGVHSLEELPELLRRVDPHATSVCLAKAEAKLSSPMFMR